MNHRTRQTVVPPGRHFPEVGLRYSSLEILFRLKKISWHRVRSDTERGGGPPENRRGLQSRRIDVLATGRAAGDVTIIRPDWVSARRVRGDTVGVAEECSAAGGDSEGWRETDARHP